MDLHLSISDGFVKTKMFEKRDDFDFDIRFARVSRHIDDFITRNKVLPAKLLGQGYRYHKIRRAFSKFNRRHFDLVSKYHVRLKTGVVGWCDGAG